VVAPLRLGPADLGRAMTLNEYLDAEVEPGYRHELARGVLEVSEVPDDPHGVLVFKFYCALAAFHQAHPGLIYRCGGGGEFQFVLPEMISGRHPDVAVALQEMPKDSRGRRPASFAVEVVSAGAEAGHRDYVTKREEYLAYGLAEYWIVDPRRRLVTILVRDGDDWSERTVKGRGSAASVVLTGFVVPLTDLWAGSRS
jgi:Uma2 family endonuclease